MDSEDALFFPDGISREELTEERIDHLRVQFAELGLGPLLATEVREQSRLAALAEHGQGEELWIFGYGSLMWNPAIHHGGMVNGRVYGFHRRFCIHMAMGRGTPEKPGLTLALDHGGACRGKAVRIAADLVESETTILWRREMITGSYCPTWVMVHSDIGPRRALTFVINREHDRYLAELSHRDTVRMIATAEGMLGKCCDYLINTVAHLDEVGIGDGPMHRLLDEVYAFQAGG